MYIPKSAPKKLLSDIGVLDSVAWHKIISTISVLSVVRMATLYREDASVPPEQVYQLFHFLLHLESSFNSQVSFNSECSLQRSIQHLPGERYATRNDESALASRSHESNQWEFELNPSNFKPKFHIPDSNCSHSPDSSFNFHKLCTLT